MNGYADLLKWPGAVLNLLMAEPRQRQTPGERPHGPDHANRHRSPAQKKSAIETLAGQPVGRTLKIVGFVLPPDVYQRLLEMGLTKGTTCTVMRYAPMGDPIEVKVRGYSLSLRLAEAAGVQVSCL